MKSLIFLGFIALASAATHSAYDVPIVKQVSDINPDGSFHYAYETGHGIAADVAGHLKNDVAEITGSYQYKDDDGTNYAVNYVANEHGYQPEGAHLPQIPHYISRALDWIAAHPQPEERPGKHF